MTDIIQFFKELFQKQTTAKVPFLREILKRTDDEQAAYAYWKGSSAKEEVLQFLGERLRHFKATGQQESPVLILKNASSGGFIFKYEKSDLSIKTFSFLLDYLKEQVVAECYTLNLSDVKTYVRKDYVEKTERYYLKPRFSLNKAPNKANQRYGNITLEQRLHNDQPIHLKFLCTHYRDHKFTEALDFFSLMDQILK